MTRGPKKRSAQPPADLATSMIDALAAVAFDDIPESLMPTSDEVDVLLDALMLGVLDDHLDQIAAIVKIRRDMIASVPELIAQGLFQVGDRVQFNDAVKPRYLDGHVGVITRKEFDRCVVRLDEPVGRDADGEVKARASSLMKIGPE